jgi:hypothetical protein
VLDSNRATIGITASQDALYRLHTNGSIFRRTGSGWTLLLNDNPAPGRSW